MTRVVNLLSFKSESLSEQKAKDIVDCTVHVNKTEGTTNNRIQVALNDFTVTPKHDGPYLVESLTSYTYNNTFTDAIVELRIDDVVEWHCRVEPKDIGVDNSIPAVNRTVHNAVSGVPFNVKVVVYASGNSVLSYKGSIAKVERILGDVIYAD